MIPSITHRSILPSAIRTTQVVLEPDFESLSFPDKLKKIGFIDDQFNLLFTPSKIPPISHRGQNRWQQLLERDIPCCNEGIKQSDYIEGFSKSLSEKGIKSKTYLRGGYASYVACTTEYFEFALLEFLNEKKLDKALFAKELKELRNQETKSKAPHDVDLFDLVENGMPPSMLLAFYVGYMRDCGKGDIEYLQKLIPTVSDLFPYKEDYVLFTIGDKHFQNDRIIGKLLHPYLFIRDDIKIEIKNNKISIPESAGSFWQMVVERTLKVARTEPWHEKDFRAGLAALQLMQDGHILIQDNCSLQSIINYAISTKDEKVLSGAIDRAKLHCKKTYGFLMSVLIAYLHADPHADVQILKDAIGETPTLPSLYQLALLLTIYEDKTKTYRAEWDSNGFLILHVNEDRIFFPKNFALTKGSDVSLISSRLGPNTKVCPCPHELIYELLEDKLGILERVLFELALQKPLTPQTALYDALLDYLQSPEREDLNALCSLLPKEFLNAHQLPANQGWIKALVQCSFRHGLLLFNQITNQTIRWEALDEIISLIGRDRPNQAYALIDAEPLPKDLRLKLLKKLIPLPLEELISENAITIGMESSIIETLEKLPPEKQVMLGKQLPPFPKILQFLDRLIALSDQEWFFSTNPSLERVEALPELLIRWIEWHADEKVASAAVQKHKQILKASPAYTRLIRQFQLAELAKDWIGSFPFPQKEAQALLFFTDYEPKDHPLLAAVCSLPGIHEKKLLEALHLKGYPVFSNRPASELLYFLDMNFPEELKNLILSKLMPKDLEPIKRWMNQNPPIFLDFASLILESKDGTFLPFVLQSLPELQKTKFRQKADALLQKALDLGLIHLESKDAELKTTPLVLLKDVLEEMYNQKMNSPDKIRKFFDILAADLLDKIQTNDDEREYCFAVLFELLYLGMRAKLDRVKVFEQIEMLIAITSGMRENRSLIERQIPVFIQSIPLISFDSPEIHNEWNEKLQELIEDWKQMPVYNKEQEDLKQTKSYLLLQTLPFELAESSFHHAHQLQSIIEQYVSNRVSKKELQFAVQKIEKSPYQKLALKDPCMICINDLLPLLEINKTRVKAYEAFHYLLDEWKIESPYIEKQRAYLQIRQKTEKLITTKVHDMENNKILYCEFLDAVTVHLISLTDSLANQMLNVHDPILDALDLESIKLLDKIEVLRLWLKILDANHLNPFQAEVIRGCIIDLSSKLEVNEVCQYFVLRTASLKLITLSHDRIQAEIATITGSAFFFLPEDKLKALIKTMEHFLCRKISYNYKK